MKLLDAFLSPRLRALIGKEFAQIRRDRRLALSLVLPPVVQLVLFGFALNADVSHLKLGIVDDSRSVESRDLIAAMTENGSFDLARSYGSVKELSDALARGNLDAGLTIPVNFEKDLERGRPVDVQVLLNAMNANTAAIAQGYAEGVIQNWNHDLTQSGIHAHFTRVATNPVTLRGIVSLHPAFLFNPALITNWFTVTGTFGVLLMLNGSVISSASLIKERERGTVEQLLMTPATTSEIVIAKILPLFLLLCLLVLFAASLLKIIFDVPFRGNVFLVLSGGALCVLCGIGVGTFIATYTKSAQQAQLMAFFINPPLSSLSGSLTPVEAMPHWLQPVTLINPIRHFGIITRSCLMKGSGLDTLWPNYLALVGFATVLLTLSVRRFRKQLG
ncbi:MAG TPA: ABC transporter permease [Bryobacteraceae bacterium]|nr:ABC transporter permease [Bryobacteraceae bacterium]